MSTQKWFNAEYEGYQIDGTYTDGDGSLEVEIEEVYVNGSSNDARAIMSKSVIDYLQAQIEYGNVWTYRSEQRVRFHSDVMRRAA